MSTPLSNPTSYLPVAEFLNRCDQNIVAQLCSDSQVRVSTSSLAGDPKLAAALLDASGLVEAAAMMREAYVPADLAALTGASLGLLYRICHDYTWWFLYDRRKDLVARLPVSFETSQEFMDRLSKGERIFGIKEVADAGLQSHVVETACQVTQRDGIVEQNSRWFGKRANRESFRG